MAWVQTRSGAVYNYNDRDEAEPVKRDENGRFVGSGNPKGRPRKSKYPEPKTFAATLSAVLDKTITTHGPGGKQTMSQMQALAMQMVSDALKGGPIDRLRFMRTLKGLGFFNPGDLAEYHDACNVAESGEGWTPELEARYQVIESEFRGCEEDAAGDPF